MDLEPLRRLHGGEALPENRAVGAREDRLHPAHGILERDPALPLTAVLEVIEEVHDEDEDVSRPSRAKSLEHRVRRFVLLGRDEEAEGLGRCLRRPHDVLEQRLGLLGGPRAQDLPCRIAQGILLPVDEELGDGRPVLGASGRQALHGAAGIIGPGQVLERRREDPGSVASKHLPEDLAVGARIAPLQDERGLDGLRDVVLIADEEQLLPDPVPGGGKLALAAPRHLPRELAGIGPLRALEPAD